MARVGRCSGGTLERDGSMSARRLTLMVIASLCALVGALAFLCAPALSFTGHPYEPPQITELQIASEPPPALGSFQPAGLAVDNSPTSLSSGDLYVADGENRVVDKFSSLRVYETQWTGTPSGRFGELYGVAVDSGGAVYVADRGKDVVDKFDSSGVFIPGPGGPSSAFI